MSPLLKFKVVHNSKMNRYILAPHSFFHWKARWPFAVGFMQQTKRCLFQCFGYFVKMQNFTWLVVISENMIAISFLWNPLCHISDFYDLLKKWTHLSWSCQTAYLNMKWHTYQARWLQKALRLNLLSMLLYVKASIKMKPTLMKPPLCWQWRIISEPRSRHTLFTSCSSLAGKRGLSCLIPEMFRHFYGELLISA